MILPPLVFTALWDPQWSNCPRCIKCDHFSKVALCLVKFFFFQTRKHLFSNARKQTFVYGYAALMHGRILQEGGLDTGMM
jgi:hypothetical protein